MNNNNDREYHLGFSYFNKIGPTRLKRLENYFPNLKEAFHAQHSDLLLAGLPTKLISEFIAWRSSFSLNHVLQELNEKKIKFVTWQDKNYPSILREIPASPPILYFKGQLLERKRPRLAVVGSRKPSIYAKRIIQKLLPKIINRGIEIVSGLALGVDSWAHQVVIAQQGITLAILGSGLDANRLYPSSNRSLAENIINCGGAIISEFSPNTPPAKQNFPQRNRLISGLSQATLVIEAKARSGALITANYALEQNREVLAVPGSIFSELSEGPNNLISQGAQSVSTAEDILEILAVENIPLTTTELNNKKAKKLRLI